MQEFIQHPEDVRHSVCVYPLCSVEYSCAQIYVYVIHRSTQVSGGYILLKDRLNAKQAEWNTGSGGGHASWSLGSCPQGWCPQHGEQEVLSVSTARWENWVHRKGRGDISHCPDCGEAEAICSQQTVVRQAAPGRAWKEVAAAAPSCAPKCCSHTGPFAEGVLLSYKMVINAKFLSLFSLWLGFIIEIKDRR